MEPFPFFVVRHGRAPGFHDAGRRRRPQWISPLSVSAYRRYRVRTTGDVPMLCTCKPDMSSSIIPSNRYGNAQILPRPSNLAPSFLCIQLAHDTRRQPALGAYVDENRCSIGRLQIPTNPPMLRHRPYLPTLCDKSAASRRRRLLVA